MLSYNLLHSVPAQQSESALSTDNVALGLKDLFRSNLFEAEDVLRECCRNASLEHFDRTCMPPPFGSTESMYNADIRVMYTAGAQADGLSFVYLRLAVNLIFVGLAPHREHH